MATRCSPPLGNFKFPSDMKSDLIYCQRALRTHLKVHQMVVDQYSSEKDCATAKSACLDELENEIYEINCEQQYVMLRVRRIIDEYFKSLSPEELAMGRLLMNDYVSKQVVPLIQNKDYICIPNMVRPRFSEKELIETYLLADGLKTSTMSLTPPPPVEVPQLPAEQLIPVPFNPKQVSLLKPISERVVKPTPAVLPEIIIPDEEKPVPPVSSKVKLSRLNLRQALNKAAAAINVAPAPQPVPVAVIPAPKPTKIVVKQTAKPVTKSDPSSSEESVELRMPSPQQLDMKTTPDDYNQEGFMAVFNLFTREHIQLLQQRRSKRKRRSVHNNEKADYHYGGFDQLLSPQASTSKRRRKEFLLSPRVNRALKKKRSSDADRSNSSSPDEKVACNECLKLTGVVVQCKQCPGRYHAKCHKDPNIKVIVGQCPSCSRVQYSAKLQEDAEKKTNTDALRGQYRELEEKLAMEQKRREKLREESNMYKIGMSKLFNLVDGIKSDGNES